MASSETTTMSSQATSLLATEEGVLPRSSSTGTLSTLQSSLSPTDSVSQIQVHSRRRKPGHYDTDDLTDLSASEEENDLREFRVVSLATTYAHFFVFYLGRVRRVWTAKCYKSFDKATLKRDSNGKVSTLKTEKGTFAIYSFKCKRCVLLSFIASSYSY
jgi:hypothetical protein